MEDMVKDSKKEPEKRKKVIWEYDGEKSEIRVSDNSIKADAEKRFTFKLERYKDSETREESLKITCFLDGKKNGFIVTSICDLENDIKQFRRFGVVLENTYYRDLYKTIELNYLDIHDSEISSAEINSKMTDLISQIKLYLADDKDLITQDLCYVPVNMFNDLAHDCNYYDFEMKSLREALYKDGYIRTMSGRYAILTRIKDKPERVIAFYRDKLGIELPEKKDNKKTEKSD